MHSVNRFVWIPNLTANSQRWTFWRLAKGNKMWNGNISIFLSLPFFSIYMIYYNIAWDALQSTWFTATAAAAKKIVEMNWSENIVIAIVSFVTWFIIHNNNNEWKKKRTENESTKRTIPVMTMSRDDIVCAHISLSLCLTSFVHKTESFSRWKLFTR